MESTIDLGRQVGVGTVRMNGLKVGDQLFFVPVSPANSPANWSAVSASKTVTVSKIGPTWTHLDGGKLRMSTVTLLGGNCPTGWDAITTGGQKAGEIYSCIEEFQHHMAVNTFWQHQLKIPVHAPRNMTLAKIEAIKKILESGEPAVVESLSFLDTPEILHKGALIGGIIESLSHLPRLRAEEIILMWFSYDDLVRMWDTITGHMPMPPKPEVKGKK